APSSPGRNRTSPVPAASGRTRTSGTHGLKAAYVPTSGARSAGRLVAAGPGRGSTAGGSATAGGGSGGASCPSTAARSRARPWTTTAQAPEAPGGAQGPLPSAATPTPVSAHP